jgi:hypothetical protein
MAGDLLMYRKYINIVEAANKGCPIATYDIDVNLKNRQKAIEEYHYGPANPDEPESYWKEAAKRWDITEKTAKTMKCGNCAAFDVSVIKCGHVLKRVSKVMRKLLMLWPQSTRQT